MAQKRFRKGYVLGDTGLIDEVGEPKWFIENINSVSDLEKNWDKVIDKLNELAEENTRLKERNNRQCKQLDNLYKLIEKQDWETLTGIIQELKEANEILQKEWSEIE